MEWGKDDDDDADDADVDTDVNDVVVPAATTNDCPQQPLPRKRHVQICHHTHKIVIRCNDDDDIMNDAQ